LADAPNAGVGVGMLKPDDAAGGAAAGGKGDAGAGANVTAWPALAFAVVAAKRGTRRRECFLSSTNTELL
jgi:hypothetical protein